MRAEVFSHRALRISSRSVHYLHMDGQFNPADLSSPFPSTTKAIPDTPYHIDYTESRRSGHSVSPMGTPPTRLHFPTAISPIHHSSNFPEATYHPVVPASNQNLEGIMFRGNEVLFETLPNLDVPHHGAGSQIDSAGWVPLNLSSSMTNDVWTFKYNVSFRCHG